jgi:hypothetical protein
MYYIPENETLIYSISCFLLRVNFPADGLFKMKIVWEYKLQHSTISIITLSCSKYTVWQLILLAVLLQNYNDDDLKSKENMWVINIMW